MPILPVLDLMQGQIVRGIAGRRDEYRPMVSTLTDSVEPLAVARAFRTHVGFDEFYLADLDAIQHGRPAYDWYAQILQGGFRLWIDAGIRSPEDAVFLKLIPEVETSIVVGLESVDGPEALRRIVDQAGAARVVFSLDLKAGRPLGSADAWKSDNPWTIAEHAVTVLEVRRLIVLDLARVGVGKGAGTEVLCERLKRAFPEIELTAGGGVRGMNDVNRLTDIGVDRVLVASALHDGQITRADLMRT